MRVTPTVIAPPSRGGDKPWRLRNWRLRTKLFVVLLVPLVLAGALGWLRVAASSQSTADLNDLVDRVTLGQQVSELTQQLQAERSRAAAFVASDRREFRAEYDEQVARVDSMIGVLLNTPAEDFGPAAVDIARNAQVRMQGLVHLRSATVDTRYPAASVTFTYSQLIDGLQALTRAVFTTPDLQLLRQAQDVLLISDIKEQIEHEHASLLAILLANGSTTTDQTVARSTAAQLDSALAEFNASGSPAARDLFARVVSGPDVDNRERIETSTLSALSADNPLTIPATQWDTSAQATADRVRQVEVQLQEQLRTDGAALASAASAGAFRDGVIVAVALAIALALLLIVVRAIAGPLRILRNAAFQIAQIRLPQAIERMQDPENQQTVMAVEPIGVHSREEIGQVARAFDAVHAEAVRLAGEQALLRANVNDIFVNLSRRSQGLVKRQLGLIDKLEADEQDPDHLGDLFQLDHLATRMRRNNENLLVLAGAAELRPRRRRPVPADDVLRAAVSEVEDYQRIVVRRAPTVSVSGPAVNDLVHLMAELLDNATNFSPPESTVVLASSMTADGSLVVEISDSGVGIEPATLQVINTELANPPTVDVAVSRRMGLFVVGRLALRNEISVRLESASAGQGMVAIVTVPSSLLMTPAEAAAAEMATSEFPASGRQTSPGWSPAEPAVPAPRPVNALPAAARMPARQQTDQLFTREQDPAGAPRQGRAAEPIVPAPRRDSDTRVNAWNDGGSSPAMSPPRMPQQQAPTWPPRPEQQQRPTPSTPPPAALPPRTPAPVPRQQDPLNDLFEPGPANPEPQTEDDAPIYDEVRTSWFRMQQLGANGDPNGDGNGNRPAGNGQPDRRPSNGGPVGNGAPRPMVEGKTSAIPAAGQRAGNGSTSNGSTSNGSTGNGTAANGTTGQGGTESMPAGNGQSGNLWSPPESGPRPAPASESQPAAVDQRRRAEEPNGDRSMPTQQGQRGSSPQPAAASAERPPSPSPSLAPGASEWGPIENGWRAAREFTELTREYLTESGLPKRRRGNKPLPGSFAETNPSTGPAPRNPEAVRGRLQEYQQGLRHGRYAQRSDQPDLADHPGSARGSE